MLRVYKAEKRQNLNQEREIENRGYFPKEVVFEHWPERGK